LKSKYTISGCRLILYDGSYMQVFTVYRCITNWLLLCSTYIYNQFPSILSLMDYLHVSQHIYSMLWASLSIPVTVIRTRFLDFLEVKPKQLLIFHIHVLFNRINFVSDRLDAEHYCLDLQIDYMIPSFHQPVFYKIFSLSW